jgi:uncharacterized protein (TIGR02145 family)
MKNSVFNFLLLTVFAVITFVFFACSSDDGGDGGSSSSEGTQGGVSSSSDDGEGNSQSYSYCIYIEAQVCVAGPYKDCPAGGIPSNSCPYSYVGPSSSSDGGSQDGGSSSSSEPPLSSSSSEPPLSSSSSELPPSSSSQSTPPPSSNSSGPWFCDYGPRHTCFESGCENFIGGGCFEISGPNPGAAECDQQWATITQSCATSGDFCDYGPLTVDTGDDCGGTGYCGGCYKYASNCIVDGGSRVSTCPASSLEVSEVTQTSFTDTRDNKVYKTVVIGTQTWMAENLNYNPSTGESSCYDNQASYCTTYGRLYDWATAMGLPASCNSSSCSSQIQSKHSGICPNGWHLPTDQEWDILRFYVDPSGSNAGKLKARNGWAASGNGTDDYSFSALPSGQYYENSGEFSAAGRSGYWWDATENSSERAFNRSLFFDDNELHREYSNKIDMYSVRCLKN